MSTDEEKARAEAEARRQRILDASANRMDLVAGLMSKDEMPASSGASKMAAMRRKRFKKKAAKEEDKPAAAGAEPSEPVAEERSAPTEESSAPPTEDTPATVEAAEEVKAQDESVPAEPVQEEIPKKKYEGVAKMRRRKIKEKQEQSETTVSFDIPKSKPKLKVSRIPIVMHMVTVVLLFVAGLEVGFHQLEYSFQPVIHRELAPTTGLALLNKFTKPKEKETILRDLEVETEAEAEVLEDTDNFEEEITTPEELNIDPLFGVDLDLLTAGPGIVNFFARYAVKAHRMVLALVYYGPIRFVTGFVSFCQNMAAHPPLLMLCAIVIRQLVGKKILGADLLKENAKEQKGEDVVSMVKNMVSKFILGSFPTAVHIYDVWTHLRADMYVVLCGLLVGMAWTHTEELPFSPLKEEAFGTDEL